MGGANGDVSQVTSVRVTAREPTAVGGHLVSLSIWVWLLVAYQKWAAPSPSKAGLESGRARTPAGRGLKSMDASTSGPMTSRKHSNICHRNDLGDGFDG